MDERTRIEVLGLAGSPRRGGNTDRLLDAFLSGARKAGADTSTLRLTSLRIAPCDDCGGCAQDGRCIIKDDFQATSERIITADVIVLSAPLYFAALPAQAKCLVDRSQCQWVRKYRLHTALPLSHSGHARRRGFFLSAAGDRHANFEGIRRTMRYFFNVYEADYVGELLVGGVDGKGVIDLGTLQTVFTLGKSACATQEHD